MTFEVNSGDVIGERFQLLKPLGDGGMGVVWKALHLELDCFVAVKFLHADLLSDSDSRSRFEREGRLLSSFLHPNLVRCYRVGVHQIAGRELPYLAMEYVDGTTLRELLIDEGALSWRRVLSIGIQVCDAMTCVHEKNVVHRDIKPNNIMVLTNAKPDDEHSVKVVDFGLARLVPGQAAVSQHLTQTGALVGSVYYLSPEQCSGKRADAASDIYALGCVLYECLCDAPPLVADSPIGILHRHANDDPAPLSMAGIPETLNDVLFKAMAKLPQDRYRSMSDFGRDLQKLLQGEGDLLATGFYGTRRQVGAKGVPKKAVATVLAICVIVCAFLLLTPAGIRFAGSFCYPGGIGLNSMIMQADTMCRWGMRSQAVCLLDEAAGRLLVRSKDPVDDARKLTMIATLQRQLNLDASYAAEEAVVRFAEARTLNGDVTDSLLKALSLLKASWGSGGRVFLSSRRAEELHRALNRLCHLGESEKRCRLSLAIVEFMVSGPWQTDFDLARAGGSVAFATGDYKKSLLYDLQAIRCGRWNTSVKLSEFAYQLFARYESILDTEAMLEVARTVLKTAPTGASSLRLEVISAFKDHYYACIRKKLEQGDYSAARSMGRRVVRFCQQFPVDCQFGLECYYQAVIDRNDQLGRGEKTPEFLTSEFALADKDVRKLWRGPIEATNSINRGGDNNRSGANKQDFKLEAGAALYRWRRGEQSRECDEAVAEALSAQHLLADRSEKKKRHMLYAQVICLRREMSGEHDPYYLAILANYLNEASSAEQQRLLPSFEQALVQTTGMFKQVGLQWYFANAALNVCPARLKAGQYREALKVQEACLRNYRWFVLIKSAGRPAGVTFSGSINAMYLLILYVQTLNCMHRSDEAFKFVDFVARRACEECTHECAFINGVVPLLIACKQTGHGNQAAKIYQQALATLSKHSPDSVPTIEKWWHGQLQLSPFL